MSGDHDGTAGSQGPAVPASEGDAEHDRAAGSKAVPPLAPSPPEGGRGPEGPLGVWEDSGASRSEGADNHPPAGGGPPSPEAEVPPSGEGLRAEAAWRGVPLPSERDLKRRYGLEIPDYLEILDVQAWVCGLCRRPPKDGKPLVVDHDHQSLVIRGLLHLSCNRFVSEAVIAYLAHPPAAALGLVVPESREQATIAKRERAKTAARDRRAGAAEARQKRAGRRGQLGAALAAADYDEQIAAANERAARARAESAAAAQAARAFVASYTAALREASEQARQEPPPGPVRRALRRWRQHWPPTAGG